MEITIPKTAKQIKNSKDYIDIDGTVYTYVSNYKGIISDKVIKKAQHLCYGYCYCGIYDTKTHKVKQKRVHRLVAETFIPNPDGLPIVGHRNNIKSDNRVENLYWTTNQENIQKAVDDGLMKNRIGFEDEQSKPVIMYETVTNKVLGVYGSICEATRETSLSKTTIARQAKYHRPVRKPYYFRYLDDEGANPNRLVGEYDYITDKLLYVYYSVANAAKVTQICEKTISQQCRCGKPKTKFRDTYFKYIN